MITVCLLDQVEHIEPAPQRLSGQLLGIHWRPSETPKQKSLLLPHPGSWTSVSPRAVVSKEPVSVLIPKGHSTMAEEEGRQVLQESSILKLSWDMSLWFVL